ncbi:TIGR02594 family protein [Chryseobacterium sp. S0630]|uniref:TIGR02594 family protein n=1 Tax=Chryseobacterium sp. S0630 TaxID=2957803 RepID=UPI00209DC8CF|nr:TIGR02594 family protein [Chryseobacterium sp. S0630]MCP1299775.1 TIGR02594 family protein [Chryseobacterium sp. S0630]
MADKGYIIIEGATAYCSSSVTNNSNGTAVPMEVKSQKKKLGKNKYFAQNKPVATYLDDKADSFGGGNGFGNCKGSDGKTYPCKGKCNIKYKDYYENVEFNKSMKILLDASTGNCPGYGVPGTIAFATTGQANNVSQIDVKEADEFSVANTSPQWPSSSASEASIAVSSISMIRPIPTDKLNGTYYYIKGMNGPLLPIMNPFGGDNLDLKALFKGDEKKIIWALFKGEGTKDKIKTFIGLGSNFSQSMSKIFDGLTEGKYRLEAYGKKAGDAKCSLNVEVVQDFVKKIVSPGSSTLINIPLPLSIERKLNSTTDQAKILNRGFFMPVNTVHWTVKQGTAVLYNSSSGASSSHLVSVTGAGDRVILTFKNAGKYTVEAFTDPTDPKPQSVEIKIENSLGVMGVKGEPGLVRFSDTIKVQASKFNVNYMPSGTSVYWYLKKEGVGRVALFENSPSFKTGTINKKVAELLYNDAKLASNQYFGKYILEAYANPLGTGKQPGFSGSDCFNFEVIQNVIDKFTLPAANIPKGTKIKYTATARIATLAGNEAIKIEVPDKVTNNGDGTITFNDLGEYTISAYLTGDYTDGKKIEAKVKVSEPAVKRALWAYGTGVKRTETGFGEETYGFIEIDGLQNQALKVKIWVKGEGDDFYKEKDKYMLEEKTVTLNNEGKASFLITTNDDYKKKLLAAIPKTTENPNPSYRIVFTVELQASSSGDIVLPGNITIQGTKPVVVDSATTYLEVLDSNEELVITSEQKIVSIMFSTEDGKDIQRMQTFYGKTHKLWVHTVNMTEEVLKIDVLKEIPKEGLNEKDHITYTHESKQSYNEEKTGKDGLLEVSFTAKEEWKNPPKNFDYYIAQVSRQVQDPADPKKKVWKIEKSQLTINSTLPADLVRTEDMEKLGIKAYKKDGTAFTQQEMLELRKQFIFYESGCLKVSQKETPEAIENDVMPVVVEMAEVRKQKTCYCNRDFTESEIKSLVKHMRGKEEIWESTDMDRESFADLTMELNAMFRKYDINKCIQKIAFLANVYSETSFFRTAGEESSSHASSGYKYKGRGIQQLTGDGSDPVAYKDYDEKVPEDIVTYPELVATKLYLAVDSGGWFWSVYKKIPNWKENPNKDYSQAEKDAMKFKREYFSKALGKTLNETALLMEDEEERYYFLICKVLNGYTLTHKLEVNPNGWEHRKQGLSNLKAWFKYDKKVCDGEAVAMPNLEGRAPWMELVWKEEARNLVETGTNKEIQKFFDGTPYENAMKNGTENETTIAWCAAFVNWIMKHYGYEGVTTDKGYDAVRALKWATWAEGKDLKKPVYGAIAVKTRTGGGHVGFVAGKKGNKVVILGGNQSQKLYCVAYEISDYYAYVVPTNYEITDADYNLPEYKGNPGAKGSEL